MSTKIYCAYRVPMARFSEATSVLHDLLSEHFYGILSRQLDRSYYKQNPQYLIKWIAETERKLAQVQKENPFEFNTEYSFGFNFFLDQESAYIIPYGTWSLETPDWFEDFHYQDQVDRDEGISDEEWKLRKLKWNELLIRNSKPQQYSYSVVDPSSGFYLAFADHIRRWVDEKLKENPIAP